VADIKTFKGDVEPPRIVWTEEGETGIADLFNGNHRLKLLQMETAEHMKQWQECVKRREQYKLLAKKSKAQTTQNQRDEELSQELLTILGRTGLFTVKLFDLGECLKAHRTLQVEIYVMITDAIDRSPLKSMILHGLSNNVHIAHRADSAEDGFIHAFQSLHNKGAYNEASKEKHFEWIKKTYGGTQISWVLSKEPLMECLKELMAFEYFEQGGKVPITLSSNWSTHGTKGSVSEDHQILNGSIY
jgi:hypothetical protein